MYLIILATIITTTTAHHQCKGIFFNEKYYDIDIIKEGINKVHQIDLNRRDNTLYFVFDQIATYPTSALGYFNIETKKTGIIDGIRNATSVAIDQLYNVVYAGGSEGLYKIYNKIPEQLAVHDHIQSMFFKDVLYYTNRRKQAYTYMNGYKNVVPELAGIEVDRIVVDDDNNLFFLQNRKLFRVKIGTRAVNSHERFTIDFIATDSYFKVYINANDGIYVYNKYKYALDKVSDVKDVKELTFNDRNEPIYVVADVIIKLNYNPIPCFDH